MVHEQGSGIPLLWIHGFPLSAEVFAPQVSIPGVRHLRPDLPGFGKSAPRRIESMTEYAQVLIDILDDRQIEHAVVAGLSMGGYIAMELLRKAPQRVSGLILLDTRETPDDETARAKRVATAREVEASGIAPVVESMLPKMLSDTADPTLRATTQQMMMGSSPEGVIAALHSMAGRPDSTATLSQLTLPTLIIVGEKDAITPVADSERMQRLVRGSRLVVVPGAAHLANVERPDVVNKEISDFLLLL